MFHGSPLPLSPNVPLSELLARSRPPEPLGAWISGNISRLHIHTIECCSRRRVLASTDLGYLLSCCTEIAVRERERTVVLAAETVIHWRALQVATATPYLPGIERLRAIFPNLQATATGFLIPLQGESPEAVLALCREEGIGVGESRIVYASSGSTATPPTALTLRARR